jgi:hypothetical protein
MNSDDAREIEDLDVQITHNYDGAVDAEGRQLQRE